jgi:hypothetical protein
MTAGTSAEPDWLTDLAKARVRARQAQKPLLFDLWDPT